MTSVFNEIDALIIAGSIRAVRKEGQPDITLEIQIEGRPVGQINIPPDHYYFAYVQRELNRAAERGRTIHA